MQDANLTRLYSALRNNLLICLVLDFLSFTVVPSCCHLPWSLHRQQCARLAPRSPVPLPSKDHLQQAADFSCSSYNCIPFVHAPLLDFYCTSYFYTPFRDESQ